jgi:hypothetical protein
MLLASYWLTGQFCDATKEKNDVVERLGASRHLVTIVIGAVDVDASGP